MDYALITSVVTTSIGVIGGLFGILTYRTNQRLKHQEIIFPLMKEFDEDKEIYYAKELVDGISIQLRFDNQILGDMPITFKICDDRRLLIYNKDQLQFLLVGFPHPNELNQDEFVIRSIFDTFLNFLGKLGYLIDTGLVTKKELSYFLYYIDKARKNWAIIRFARDLNYELFAVLLDRMGIMPSSLKKLVDEYEKRVK